MPKFTPKSALLSPEAPTTREEAFEMIELALGDVSKLADAFNVIAEACGTLEVSAPMTEQPEPCVIDGSVLVH